MERIVLVVNPTARSADRARELVARAAGPRLVEVLETTADDPGAGQAAAAVRLGADRVLVAGGDGTVRCAAQGLRGTGVTMGLLPLGTANIYARNLGLRPGRLAAAVQTALQAPGQDLDIGVARWRPADQPESWAPEQLFGVLAGIGRDAQTVEVTTPELKRRLGWLAYLAAGARQLASPTVSMAVQLDEGPWQTQQLWSLLAGNASRIPGGIEVFPGAQLDDGRLVVTRCSVQRPDQWLAIGLKGLLHLGREVAHLQQGPARRVAVRPSEPMPVQLDGDVVARVTELVVHVDHRALRVAVPPAPRHRMARSSPGSSDH